jgi:hypothetical protein
MIKQKTNHKNKQFFSNNTFMPRKSSNNAVFPLSDGLFSQKTNILCLKQQFKINLKVNLIEFRKDFKLLQTKNRYETKIITQRKQFPVLALEYSILLPTLQSVQMN